MSKQSIELLDVCQSFKVQSVLERISMRLQQGEITTLIGPNGAGKSTLVRIVLGLLKADSGQRLCSSDLRLGYMPQKITIDPTLPLTTLRFLGLAQATRRECRAALEMAEIYHAAETPVQHLSGGEMQRALLARAVLRKPNFLILDEPVQGVDVNGQNALYNTIAALSKTLNCGVLMVSHDLHLVMSATDRVICLNKHICCSGLPAQVTQDPAYLDIFGRTTALYTHAHDHHHNLQGDVIDAAHGSCQHD